MEIISIPHANMTIFKYWFFNFFVVIVIKRSKWRDRLRQVFEEFTTFTPCFAPLKYSNNSVAVILSEIQNLKQTGCATFFSMVKIGRQTFHVVNKQLPSIHYLICGGQTAHQLKKYCTKLRKTNFQIGLLA